MPRLERPHGLYAAASACLLVSSLGGALAAPWARAESLLPYSVRTRGYSAWDSTVRGDLRTIGMAGAMVGLADSRIGAVDNPAGLGMTIDSTGLQISGSRVRDGYVQAFAEPIETQAVMATWGCYPWGLSFTAWSPQSEGDAYRLTAPSGTESFNRLNNSTREYRLSGSRVLLDDRLSLGLTLILGQNRQEIRPEGGAGGDARSAWAVGAGAGALYQLPNRVLIGASYTPPLRYAMDTASSPAATELGLPGFFQAAYSPFRLGLGAGWIPNRFFRLGAALYVIGSVPDTALLSNEGRKVGDSVSAQPRVGFSYLAVEYKELTVEVSAGGYVEGMRVVDVPARIHGTVGLEINPWIFSFGWGLDHSRFYRNYIVSAGIDVAKVLRKLNLIPPEKRHPFVGLLPNPLHLSDEGLPRALVRNWKPDAPAPNVIDVGLEMPGKVRDHILNAPEGVRALGRDVIDAIGDLPGDIVEEGGALIKRTRKAIAPDAESGAKAGRKGKGRAHPPARGAGKRSRD